MQRAMRLQAELFAARKYGWNFVRDAWKMKLLEKKDILSLSLSLRSKKCYEFELSVRSP